MGSDTPEEGRADAWLLDLLASTLERVDPVPEWLVRESEYVFATRDADLDVELAALIADSAVDEPAVAARSLPGDGEPRLLTFEAGDLAIEVELAGTPRGTSVRGQIVPRQQLQVTAQSRGSAAPQHSSRPQHAPHQQAPDRQPGAGGEVRTDVQGRFVVDAVPPGPFRLILRRAGRPAVATSWILID